MKREWKENGFENCIIHETGQPTLNYVVIFDICYIYLLSITYILENSQYLRIYIL